MATCSGFLFGLEGPQRHSAGAWSSAAGANRPQRRDGAQRRGCHVLLLFDRWRLAWAVRAIAPIDLFLEARQQPLALAQPGFDFVAPLGLEPIAIADALEPAAD